MTEEELARKVVIDVMRDAAIRRTEERLGRIEERLGRIEERLGRLETLIADIARKLDA